MDKQFIVVAVTTVEAGGGGGGAAYAWGFSNIPLKEQGWIEIDVRHQRSLEKNEFKAIRMMSSEEACAIRDAALKYDLSEMVIAIMPVVGVVMPSATISVEGLPARMSSFHGADKDTGTPCIYDTISEAYVKELERRLGIGAPK